jgi:hypothetical protein
MYPASHGAFLGAIAPFNATLIVQVVAQLVFPCFITWHRLSSKTFKV